jgi:hypothetical protein
LAPNYLGRTGNSYLFGQTTTMKTSVVMPTRGRPERCKQALESLFATAEGEIELIVGFNPDSQYPVDERAKVYLSPTGPSQRTGEMAAMATGEIIMQGSDDFLWRTPGWDRIFHEKAEKHPIACFFFNDGRPEDKMDSCIPVVTRKFYEIAGYFPSYFFHFYGDTWVADIANMAGCLRYVPEVVIEHMHPKFRKAQSDETYGMRGSPDGFLYQQKLGERKELAHRLKEAISALATG